MPVLKAMITRGNFNQTFLRQCLYRILDNVDKNLLQIVFWTLYRRNTGFKVQFRLNFLFCIERIFKKIVQFNQ